MSCFSVNDEQFSTLSSFHYPSLMVNALPPSSPNCPSPSALPFPCLNCATPSPSLSPAFRPSPVSCAPSRFTPSPMPVRPTARVSTLACDPHDHDRAPKRGDLDNQGRSPSGPSHKNDSV